MISEGAPDGIGSKSNRLKMAVSVRWISPRFKGPFGCAGDRTEQLFVCHRLGSGTIRLNSAQFLRSASPAEVQTDARGRNAALQPRPDRPEIGKQRLHQRRGEIPAPLDPPVPSFAPIVRCTILTWR